MRVRYDKSTVPSHCDRPQGSLHKEASLRARGPVAAFGFPYDYAVHVYVAPWSEFPIVPWVCGIQFLSRCAGLHGIQFLLRCPGCAVFNCGLSRCAGLVFNCGLSRCAGLGSFHTEAWMGPPQGERAPRVGPESIIICPGPHHRPQGSLHKEALRRARGASRRESIWCPPSLNCYPRYIRAKVLSEMIYSGTDPESYITEYTSVYDYYLSGVGLSLHTQVPSGIIP